MVFSTDSDLNSLSLGAGRLDSYVLALNELILNNIILTERMMRCFIAVDVYTIIANIFEIFSTLCCKVFEKLYIFAMEN